MAPTAEIEAQNSPPDSPLEPDPARGASNDDDPDPHTLAGQQKIEMYFNNEGEPYTGLFLDKLCDVLGVPSTKELLR
jgi:hypothetical protein